MEDNRIRVLLAEKKMSAAALATKTGMSKVCMSFIMNGIAMPTREGVQAMTSELECLATDIWKEEALDLNVTAKRGEEPTASPLHTAEEAPKEHTEERATLPLNSLEAPVRQKAEKRDGHEGQERVFFWFRPEEKAALVKAVKGLGYHSTAEWMREMYRQTLKQYAALKLEGKTLHDLIPPIVEPITPATKTS